MKRKVFVAIYCDQGDSCDGKPRVLGIYKTHDEAVKQVLLDMDTYIDSLEDAEYEEDRNQYFVNVNGGFSGCDWSIDECEIDLD